MTLALRILIASSIFCVVIITILLLQKKGFLKHLFFTVSMLVFSMLFLVCASAFFRYEYSGYQGLYKWDERPSKINQKLNDYKFNNLEIDVLEEFSNSKNTLIGYGKFLEESAQTYNPEEHPYNSLLIEYFISNFEKNEYNLEYWQEVDTIINSIYTGENPYYNIKNTDPYYPITIVPSYYELNNAFQSQNTYQEFSKIEDIEYQGKVLYLQRKIKNFDRSSESIEELWKRNKVFIYTIISKSTYSSISKMVDDLITIYDRIIQEPNYKEFYLKHNIYTDTEYHDSYDNEVFLSFPTKEFVQYHRSWGFGFWDRRIEEENDKTVYKILKEIQAHYKY